MGAFWMILAGIAFAAINSAIQYLGMNLGVPSASVALLQYLIALLVLIPFLPRFGIREALRTELHPLHILRVLISVIGIQLWTYALAYPVPIWQGIALLMTSPLFATVGSGLFLGEQVSRERWLATMIGFAGAMIILEPWSDRFTWASLLPVAAAFFWATASLMVKRISREDSPTTIVLYLLLLMFPFNLLIALPTFSIPSGGLTWGLLLFAGALTALAQWAIGKAYAIADASYVQPFDHAKLPFNVLAGWVVFGWIPPGRLWWGAGLIIFAVTYIAQHEQRKKRNP